MKNRILAFRFLCSGLILVILKSNQASAQTPYWGYLKSEVSVGENGEAKATVELNLPKGTFVQPSLSISYNSQAGDGILGLGFSLEGAYQAITRTAPTYAQDGFTTGIRFNPDSDRFALNGERLMATFAYKNVATGYLTNSTATGFRTEQESFSKVIPHISLNSLSSKYEADSFTVYSKDGLILDFGYTSDSRVSTGNSKRILAWLLNKVRDRNGNYFAISYLQNSLTGEFFPSEIKYTGNSSANVLPYNKISFNYELRPDSTTKYINGSFIKCTKRLKEILIYDHNLLHRRYKLDYMPNTVNSQLSAITEYGSDNTTSLSPLNFNWKASISGFDKKEWGTSFREQLSGYLDNFSHVFVGDYNADGKSDVLLSSDAANVPWQLLTSTGTDFTLTALPAGISTTLIGDFNGDGNYDFAGYLGTQLCVWIKTATGFVQQNWGGNINGLMSSVKRVGDFNNDGLSDIICFTQNGTQNAGIWRINLSNGSGFTSITCFDGYTHNSNFITVADFNGDGKSDIIRDSAGVYWSVSFSSGNGFQKVSTDSLGSAVNLELIADYNNDGMADIPAPLGNDFTVHLSTGKAHSYKTVNIADLTGYSSHTPQTFSDFNGDGEIDLLFGNQIWINQSGTNLANSWSLVTQGAIQTTYGDFNGDGMTDILEFGSNQGPNARHVFDIHTSKCIKKFVETIVDGNGITHTFNYKALTDNNYYTKGTTEVYPRLDMQAPFYVVNELNMTDGASYNESVTYKYERAKLDLKGRGFRGFEKVTITNTLQNQVQTNVFSTDSKYLSSRLIHSDRKTINGILLSSKDDSIGVNRFGFVNDTVAFSYYAKTNEHEYDLNGAELSAKITLYTYDSYGNPTQITENFSNTPSYKIITANTYTNSSSSWKLGRLTASTVSKTLTGSPTITRNSTFVYDSKGNLTTETYLPSDPILKKTITYTLDVFGNRKTIKTSGAGITSRSDKITYDSDGRYVLQLQNAIGKIIRKYYKNGYLSSERDADSLLTTYGRDVFGREIKVTSPDGTIATTQQSFCAAGCPVGAFYFIKSQSTGSGGDKTAYLDRLNRIIRSVSVGYGTNGNIYSDKFYNSDGTVNKESEPYYAGSSSINYTTYSYDPIKRVLVQTLPGNRTVQTSYNGLTTVITNFEGQSKTTIINKLGKPVTFIDAKNNTLSYEYDSDLNTKKITDVNGNQTLFNFDLSGNKIYMKDPDMGIYLYEYNCLNLLTKQISPASEVTTFTYDLLNRMKTRTENEGVYSWTYDPKYGAGEISTAKFQSQNVESFTYNSTGKLYKHFYYRNGVSKTITYYYDAATGMLNEALYPNSVRLKYFYSNKTYLNQIIGSKIKSSDVVLWTVNDYDATDAVTQFTMGNGLITSKSFDPLTRYLLSIKTGTAQTTDLIQNYSYTYSALGNVAQRKDNKLSLTENFQYDNLNRLTQTQVVGKTAKTISYDALGNITFKSDVGTYIYGGTNNGPHRLVDINHNGVANCIYPFNEAITYTSFNYVSKIADSTSEISFVYGPSRERLTMTVKRGNQVKETNNYFGKEYVEVADSSGVITCQYFVYAGSQVIAVLSGRKPTTNPNLKISYPIYDNLGSISAYTDSAKNIFQRCSYDAWGKLRNPLTWADYDSLQNIPSFKRGFTSHDMLSMDWLIFMNARIYNPVLGRFLSPDAFIQAPDNLQSYNRYAYVMNNPLAFTDPSGHFSWRGVGQFLKKNIGTIVAVAIMIHFGIPTDFFSVVRSGVSVGFGSSFVSTLVNGGGIDNAFKSGIQAGLWGGVSAAVTYGIGSAFEEGTFNPYDVPKAVVHGVAQGTISELSGGSFRSGFLGGFTGEFGANLSRGNAVLAVIVGGTASKLGGGNFSNGAISAVFVEMYRGSEYENETTLEAKYKKRYPGIGIHELKSMGKGSNSAGMTIPGVGIFVGVNPSLDLLDHEYGHYLNFKLWASKYGTFMATIAYHSLISIPSFMNASYDTMLNKRTQNYSGFERRANKLAKGNFGDSYHENPKRFPLFKF